MGKDGITNVIGDPKYLNSRYYPELKLKQKQFTQTYSKYIYPQEFYSTYKFYIDFSIFDFVKKLIPARATLKTGLLLEPSIFERVKFNYKDIEVFIVNVYGILPIISWIVVWCQAFVLWNISLTVNSFSINVEEAINWHSTVRL